MKYIELFAGCAGMTIGLEQASKDFKCLYMNQYEPSTKKQQAFEILKKHFGNIDTILSNEDINNVEANDIPDADLWVYGLCCQNYSVANSHDANEGIHGEKGVLWWEIYRLLSEKENKPKYLLLENVDRLLISPSKQRGRDFAIMLSTLNLLGYCAEWKVIDSSEYGFPQRRKRLYMVAYHKSTPMYEEIRHNNIYINGSFRRFEFKIDSETIQDFIIDNNVGFVDTHFNKGNKKYKHPFGDYGIMIDNHVISCQTEAVYKGKFQVLEQILQEDEYVDEEFYLKEEDLPKWKYQKGSKEIPRTTKDGYSYVFKEGSMSFPDDKSKPARTIITSCGSSTPSRFTIVVERNNGRLSRLTPIEFERLQGFPDNWTKIDGISNTKRGFMMGNALVTGVIRDIGKALDEIDKGQ